MLIFCLTVSYLIKLSLSELGMCTRSKPNSVENLDIIVFSQGIFFLLNLFKIILKQYAIVH